MKLNNETLRKAVKEWLEEKAQFEGEKAYSTRQNK
tara:strand:- start:1262 stop:1366 length:105 start_codon:yes stop_codon:yes gene_type:complete